MNALYQEIGISKQAVVQYEDRQRVFDQKMAELVAAADRLRKKHPGCGVEKMYYSLRPDFIGRDRFIETMMALGYRVKRKKNYRRTTMASRVYYPNLIKGLVLEKPSQLWQSDITYIAAGAKHYYAVFLLDVYTRKIVGYQVSDHMRGEANVKALQMALRQHDPPEIHHSDRGSQYTYRQYVGLLKDHGCCISMALCAQDNAYAERIHKTIKEEYLNHWKPKTFGQLKKAMQKAVENYNKTRLHNNLDRNSPVIFEQQLKSSNGRSKKLTIFNNEIMSNPVNSI